MAAAARCREGGDGDGDGERRESRGRRGVCSRDLTERGRGERRASVARLRSKVDSWAVEGAAGLGLKTCSQLFWPTTRTAAPAVPP